MKFTFVLLTATLLNAHAGAFSQTLTLSATEMPLKKVLVEIENKTGYDVFYNSNLLKMARPVTLSVKDASLMDVLHQCFSDQPLDYYIQDKTIFITRKPLSLPQPTGDSSPFAAYAPHDITGKVVDEKGEPVAEVTVMVKGNRAGSKTDNEGQFRITVFQAGAILVFSHIGYLNKEVSAGDKTNLVVALTPDAKSLAQVTVVGVGYGQLAEREVTSAITHLSGKDLLTGANNEVLMGLQGKVAGLTVSNTSAADPNSVPTLQLRGVSSRNAGLGPLFVINGVPGGNMDNINQNDILSIDVLKGGAASAIYGTRGSNGVVLITTKTGSSHPYMLYDVYGSYDFATMLPKLLTREQFLAHKRGFDDGANTNWLKEVTRRPDFSQKHTLQFSGGSAQNNYIATIDYRKADGLDLRASKEEYGGRLNFNHSSADNRFVASVNIAPRYEYTNQADGSSFNWALTLNPTIPVRDSTGNYNYINGGLFASNPVEDAKLIQQKTNIKELDINGSFKLNILKNLNTILTIGEISSSAKKLFFKPSTLSTVILANGGNGRNQASQEQDETDQKSLEWTGNYSLNLNRHSLKLLGGYSYQYMNSQSFSAENENMPFDAVTWNNLGSGAYDQMQGISGVSSSQNSSTLVAFFGRAIYDYDKKYFLTASLRHEGSTKFGTGNKWGDFPAVSAGWLLSEEPFMKNQVNWLDELKIRGDYGVTGNQDFPSYQSLLTYSGAGYYTFNGVSYQDYGPNQNVNPYLHWETAQNFNIGIDFGLLNHRVTGSLNYYIRTNKDLLGSYSVPVPPNLATSTYVNVGTMKNSGFEIQLSAGVVRSRDFSYTVSFAGNTNNNDFVSFSNQLYNGGTYVDGVTMPGPGAPGTLERLQQGVRVGSFFTFRNAGIDNTGALQIYDKNGKIESATKGTADDKRFTGNGLPKFMASLGNNFRYKNWDLGVFLRGNFGYKIFNTNAFYLGTPAQQMNVNLLTSAYNGSKYSKLTNPLTVAILSDYFLEPGDFVKLDNVSLGYTQRLTSKYIHSVRLYATGRNLHTFTKYTGGDPDQIPITGLYPGVNGALSSYSSSLQLLFGLQVTF